MTNQELQDLIAKHKPANGVIELRDGKTFEPMANQDLAPGAWYVFAEEVDFEGAPTVVFGKGYRFGAIAQYVGEGQFYDEGDEEPVDLSYYDFAVYSHAGVTA